MQAKNHTPMKLSLETIKKMVQELEAGMKVYLNKRTLKYETVLDWDDMVDDTTFWRKETRKIEKK